LTGHLYPVKIQEETRLKSKKKPGSKPGFFRLIDPRPSMPNPYLLKIAEAFFHTTGEDSLRRILSSGKIKTLSHVARENPEEPISVEVGLLPFRREVLPAAKAVEVMSARKITDKVFLTRGKYLPTYGEYVIKKELTLPIKRVSLNSIPEEFISSRVLSTNTNSEIFVPESKVSTFQQEYPSLKVYSNKNIPAFSLLDRVKNYPTKVKDVLFAKAAELNVKRISNNALLAGSQGLGINVDASDLDVFIPYKSKYQFEKNIERLLSQYPGLKPGEFSKNKESKRVLSGSIDGVDVDLAVAYGQKAQAFKNAFLKAKDALSEQEKAEIIKKKTELKNSWVFPETRYKMYKNQVAENLGLKQTYF